jgi:hypothetical protein
MLIAVTGFSLPAVMNIKDNHRQAGEPASSRAGRDTCFGGAPHLKGISNIHTDDISGKLN